MNKVIVLMYHGLYENINELQAIPEEERPYSLSLAQFEQQLSTLLSAGIPILSPQSIFYERRSFAGTGVLLTFDDGHHSFYKHAFPTLLRLGLAAIFFVTTDFINTRKDCCSWTQLSEMSQHGMSVQSHGKTHQFLRDLSPERVTMELSDSKLEIEDKVGEKVSMISFPGGRYRKRDITIGKSLDYSFFFTSRIGDNTWLDPSTTNTVNRLPIKETFANQVTKIITEDNYWALKLWQCSAMLKNTGKSILGNHIYHGLYRRLSA